MKTKHLITIVLGGFLLLGSSFLIINQGAWSMLPPGLIGASLVYLGIKRNRTASLIFGHFTIAAGCFYVTWGVYLLPVSQPTFTGIVTRPLFWGLFSIFGGICANYHAFCKCLKEKT